MAIITVLDEGIALANTTITLEWKDTRESKTRKTDQFGQIRLSSEPGRKARCIMGTVEQPEKTSDFLVIDGNVRAELTEIFVV